MTLKILFLLFALVANTNFCEGIKCYTCAGTESSDCAKGRKSSMAIMNCDVPKKHSSHVFSYFNTSDSSEDNSVDSSMNYTSVCLKLYETDYKPRLFARGCGVFPANIDPCGFLEKHAHVVGCKSCKTNLCNDRTVYPYPDEYLLFNDID